MDALNKQLFDLTNNPAGRQMFINIIIDKLNEIGYNYKLKSFIWISFASIKLNLIDDCNKSNKWGLIIFSDKFYLYNGVYRFEFDTIHINPSQLMRKAKLEKIFTENE